MKTLSHNGIMLPVYEPVNLSIKIRGKETKLNPLQEEMAVNFVRKEHLDSFKDPIFISNFMEDFSREIGCEKLSLNEVDFSQVRNFVEKSKAAKEAMTPEEKKADLERRKKEKEVNKEKYGYAVIDGNRVEIAAYKAEPAGIFMGRGEHPLRGRWKPAVRLEEITLNLSPDAKTPSGFEKAKREWDPEGFWVAKWQNNRKYVWISETSPLRQKNDVEKYDKAWELGKRMNIVKLHIFKNLSNPSYATRKVATCCYLISELGIRVGDEKEEDEADTVGATTLRPEHITISGDVVKFNFLGKDCVPFVRDIKLPRQVISNLKEFSKNGTLFYGVDSTKVNAFLKEAMPGLTAKVFRTYLASRKVADYLEGKLLSKDAPEFLKVSIAKEANLEAAKVMNHKRKIPKTFEGTIMKKDARLEELGKKMNAKPTESTAAKIEKLATEIKTSMDSREWNLNTSLRSYVDPRVYFEWAKYYGVDLKKIYPQTLRRKFSWALGDLDAEAEKEKAELKKLKASAKAADKIIKKAYAEKS